MGDTGVTPTLAGPTLADPSALRGALAWLAHPVTVVAVVVLAVNDHMLKAAFGTWWTGKLSDVAGMVFFPALVAVALAGARAAFVGSASGRRQSRPVPPAAFSRLVVVSTALTGVGFAWVKATEAGAATASALLTVIAGTSVVRADVTDLLALPALALAVWAARASAREERGGRERVRRAVGAAMVPVALLASVATSYSGDYWPAATIVANPGITQGWVLAVQGCDKYDEDVQAWCDQPEYFRLDGETWNPVSERFDPPGGEAAPPQVQSCSVADPLLCFRIVVDGVGVEESADGGRTWDVAWRLDPSKVHMAAAYYGADADSVRSTGVAVVDTADGVVVWVSNGADGLAMRSADGQWERAGFARVPGHRSTELAPLATAGNSWERGTRDAIVWMIAMIVLTAPLLAEGITWTARPSRPRRRWTMISGGAVLAVVIAVQWDAVYPGLQVAIPGVGPLGSPWFTGALTFVVGCGWVLWAAGTRSTELRGVRHRAFWGSVGVSVATAIAAVAVGAPRPADAVVAPLVALAVCAAYVLIVRAVAPVKASATGPDA